MDRKRNIYIDEYGDPSLDTVKDGVTNHYIMAAVYVKPKDEQVVTDGMQHISNKFFSGAEVKSNSVGTNDVRRIKILKEIEELPFKLHILAVDKSSILKTGGLIFKKPFIKYMHSRLYDKLFISYSNMSICTDNHGSEEFRNGFKAYIDEKYFQSDFFSEFTFRTEDSSNEKLIQLADLAAGSFARIYDPKKLSPNGRTILALLKPHLLSTEHWPLRLRGSFEKTPDRNTHDGNIAALAKRSVLIFLERNYGSSIPDIVLRNEFLHLLMFVNEEENEDKYIHHPEVCEILTENTGIKVKNRYLRANVIAPLRDIGIPIVSSNNGVKLAVCAKDLINFMHDVETRVLPQLRRAYKMRASVLSVTDAKYDLFNDTYKLLGKICTIASEDSENSIGI